jgi:CRP-like cAMP-binding protein
MFSRKIEGFDPHAFLSSVGPGRSIMQLKPDQIVFRQGDSARALYFVQTGRVQLSVISDQGKEGVTAIHGAGEFFGQESLIEPRTHRTNAVATGTSTIVRIDSVAMTRVMESEPTLAIMFMSFMLSRNVEIEDDLVDHLFNSSEKRLARLLLKLAGIDEYGAGEGKTVGVIPKLRQEVLASRIGTTRGRINYFMNKFRKLGYIDYTGEITVRASLANILSQEDAIEPITYVDGPKTGAGDSLAARRREMAVEAALISDGNAHLADRPMPVRRPPMVANAAGHGR